MLRIERMRRISPGPAQRHRATSPDSLVERPRSVPASRGRLERRSEVWRSDRHPEGRGSFLHERHERACVTSCSTGDVSTPNEPKLRGKAARDGPASGAGADRGRSQRKGDADEVVGGALPTERIREIVVIVVIRVRSCRQVVPSGRAVRSCRYGAVPVRMPAKANQ